LFIFHNVKLRQSAQHQPEKKRVGLFAQRGRDGLRAAALGKVPFFGYFFGQAKK